MNKLPLAKRIQILTMLCEGSSMRSISHVTDVSVNTVSKLVVDAGTACAAYHDAQVRGIAARYVQCDEVWSFSYSKIRNVRTAKVPADGEGNVWTWTGIDPDSKLILSWLVGGRDADTANELIKELASRLRDPVQPATDGHKPSLGAVGGAFGANADYLRLMKIYGQTPEGQKRYSPPECIGAATSITAGSPDLTHISTSYIEWQNLTMPMQMRHFTPLSNGFSKKLEYHCHVLALYFTWYNFACIHKAHRLSPAMAAGISNGLWSMKDVAALIDARLQPATYRKRSAATEISN